VVTRAARYDDPLLNALMYPHQVRVRGELYDSAVSAAPFDTVSIVSGSISAQRQNGVRYTADVQIDPTRIPLHITDKIMPFGTCIGIYRDVILANGNIMTVAVFFGRIDAVEFSRESFHVRASDVASFMVDARFEVPVTANHGMSYIDQFTALVDDGFPGLRVYWPGDPSKLDLVINSTATWDRERVEALDSLATAMSYDWFGGPDNVIHLGVMPTDDTSPVKWIVDAGDEGVLIEHQTQLDRGAVYNAVVVNSEPTDGVPPLHSVAYLDDPNSLIQWGGPFGKVPRFYSSQFMYTQEQADNIAASMLGDAAAGQRTLNITCICNPVLDLQRKVYVDDGRGSDWNGAYYIDSYSLPLDPESSMTFVAKAAQTLSGGKVVSAPATFAEGIHYGH